MGMTMLFARHEDHYGWNAWLAERPLALGGIFLVLGLLLLASGIQDIVTRKSRGRWGTMSQGAAAVLIGMVRAVAGAGCMLYGAYKLFEGLF
jgi:hypothetical protein